jgi:hypothetical protein
MPGRKRNAGLGRFNSQFVTVPVNAEPSFGFPSPSSASSRHSTVISHCRKALRLSGAIGALVEWATMNRVSTRPRCARFARRAINSRDANARTPGPRGSSDDRLVGSDRAHGQPHPPWTGKSPSHSPITRRLSGRPGSLRAQFNWGESVTGDDVLGYEACAAR